MHKIKEKFEIKSKENQKGIYATEMIKKSELIFEFEKNYVSKPTNKTIRISQNKHQLSKNPRKAENFLNHSCVPNAYINFENLTLHAIKTIEKGSEITYNYLTTDWNNEDVFICKCNSKKCFGKINGFKNLNIKDKLKLRKHLSPFLLSKLNVELTKKE